VKDIDAVAAEIKPRASMVTREPTTFRRASHLLHRGPQGISVELLERDKKIRVRNGRAVILLSSGMSGLPESAVKAP